MLEEIKKSYVNMANNIEGWETLDKNELANLYIKYENDEIKRNYYFSALICRYWYNIGKYYNLSKLSASIEDCYDWLIHALMYALNNRKWLDPKNSIYNDPNGPDKIINRCILSTRRIFYQAANTAKRKANFTLESLDQQHENFGDSATAIINNPVNLNVVDDCNILIQKYFDEDKILEALLLDTVCYQDVFKGSKKDCNLKLCNSRLIDCLLNIDKQYIINVYNVKVDKIESILDEMHKKGKQGLNTQIKKAFYKLANSNIKEIIC